MMLKVASHTKGQHTRVAVHEENILVDTTNLDYCHLYGVARDFTYKKDRNVPSNETAKSKDDLPAYIQPSIRDFCVSQLNESCQARLSIDDSELMPSADDGDLLLACQTQEMRCQDTKDQPRLENADEVTVLMSSQDDDDLVKACERLEAENPLVSSKETSITRICDGVSWEEDNDWILKVCENIYQ